MKFVIKHIENRSLLKISNIGHFKVFFLWILLLFSFLSSIAQNVTLSGAIITQSVDHYRVGGRLRILLMLDMEHLQGLKPLRWATTI